MTYKTALVACARWEQDDIVEWVEYHRSLGIEHIYLYSNDDEPWILRKALAAHIHGRQPYVTYFHWPRVGQQLEIYLHFLHNFRSEVEWFSFLDIDEFIVIKAADTIGEFLAGYQDRADCIYLNWLLFGNGGRLVRDPSLNILPSFTRRSRSIDIHTKNIVRASAINPEGILARYRGGALGFWHFWDNYGLTLRITDVLGNRIEGYARDWPRSAQDYIQQPGYAEGCLATAYIAHFQFKSEEDFIRRYNRGGAPEAAKFHEEFQQGRHVARLAQYNAVYDVTLARYWHGRMYVAQPCPPEEDPATSGLRNVALFKPAEQSSVYTPTGPEPRGACLRDHGNDGVIRGTYGFHTKREEAPWWRLDLLEGFDIRLIRVYNRADDPACAARAAGLIIETSENGTEWTVLHRLAPNEVFGGAGTQPLSLRLAGLRAQFLRLSLPGLQALHLDEVEVFAPV